MIRIDRGQKPHTLTDEEVVRLTAVFAQSGDSVWKRADIVQGLLAATHSKCAFCECQVQQEDSFFEVEHFIPKSRRPDLVVFWDNLLPACKRCNRAKWDHDTVTHPIVDPATEDPRAHLFFQALFLRGRTAKGDLTIEVVDLNDLDRIVVPRMQVMQQVERSVSACQSALDGFIASNTVGRRNRALATIRDLLKICQRSSPFSALTSTFLHGNQNYVRLRQSLMDQGLWNDELEDLDRSSSALVLR